MDDGKKCLELYTNPRFFLDTWIEEQMKQRQQGFLNYFSKKKKIKIKNCYY